MKMLKAKYVVEPTGSVGNTYSLLLPRCKIEVRMSFNDWLHFFRTLLVQEGDFELSRLFTGLDATLMPCQIGFMVETSKPHKLLVYAEGIAEATMKHALEQYVPKYGEKSIMR